MFFHAWLCLHALGFFDPPFAFAGPTPAEALAATQATEPPESIVAALPDDGPRFEGQSQGMDALALQEGINAYGKGEWAQARRLFEKVMSQQPESSLTPTAMTFLAETALKERTSNGNRLEALERYKTLLRDYPQSMNAKRAEWRMADLYLLQGWHQEAQSMYERALSHNPQSTDGERALLGLGYIALGTKKWREAEQTFEDLRKRSGNEHILLHATIGLATALYRQHRIQEALALYDLGYRRWPRAIRMNPTALGRYASIQLDLHHDVIGRGLLLQYYNLHPAHPDTPAALLRLADSLNISQKPAGAELFYTFVASHYPGTTAASLAAIRAASLRAEQMMAAGDIPPALTVSSLMHGVTSPAQSVADALAQLRTFAVQHEGSAAGNEARFHLAAHLERSEAVTQALLVYKEVAESVRRAPDDPWPAKAADRLADILHPWMEAAARSHDDLTLTTLFHRHGPSGERHYLSSPLLLEIAEAHERLGFIAEAGRLYQSIMKGSKSPMLVEQALLGLGKVYVGQHDIAAARKVLERYRLEYPRGRFEVEALHLLVQAMADEEDFAGLLRFSRAWMIHHPQHPERPWMYQQMAAVLSRLNKQEDAILAMEEAFHAGAPKTVTALLAHADLLAQVKHYERAIEVYQTVVDKKPDAAQLQWARLQIVRSWQALNQHDRATVALAELGQTDDALITRFSNTYRHSIQQARQLPQEGL